MEFPSQVVSATCAVLLPASLEPFFTPVQGLLTMNVQNEPLDDMACVVKHGTPPKWRWKLCEFQHEKGISVPNLIEGVKTSMTYKF